MGDFDSLDLGKRVWWILEEAFITLDEIYAYDVLAFRVAFYFY